MALHRHPEQVALRQARPVRQGAREGARHQVGHQVHQEGRPTSRMQVSAGVHRQAPLPHQRCALDPSRLLRHLNLINLQGRTLEVLARLHLLRQPAGGWQPRSGHITTT